MQSRPCRAWKLGLTTPHKGPKSQAPISFQCSLSRWEHGIWDLSLHTRVPSPKPPFQFKSIHAILGIKSMVVGTYHSTQKARPNSWHHDFLHQIIKMIDATHILTGSRGSKVGTPSPCWNMLAWVWLKTWDPMWTSPWLGPANITHGENIVNCVLTCNFLLNIIWPYK